MKSYYPRGSNTPTPRYNASAVNRQIASSSRHGPKIGRKESGLIHRLLKGRTGNPLGGEGVDIMVLAVVVVGGYLLYKHYTATQAANAALASAQAQPQGPQNANPGDAFWTGGASLNTPAAYG